MEQSNLQKLPNFDFSDLGDSDSQFSRSSSSLSLPSEVPDIRNLFSSYVYESPDLDSCDNFKDSISEKVVFSLVDLVDDEKEGREKRANSCGFKRIEKRKEEIYPKNFFSTNFPLKCSNSIGDGHNNQRQSLNEDQDWCSVSLDSEPDDVSNWFSSYVYESPPFDSSDEFEHCNTENSQKEKDGLIAKEIKARKEAILGELRDTRITDEEFAREKIDLKDGSFVDIKQDKQCSNKSNDGGGRSEKPVEVQENHAFERVQTSIPIREASGSTSTPRKSKELKQIVQPERSSKRKSQNGSHAKENRGENLPENGFVPVRESRFTGSLADITNFGNSGIREVIGKWRCPQKGKPNVGPPLKQLRLEQWVQKK